ncbi:MAG TPA: hypothetical protein VGM28_03560 [Candidatus Limnocylindrales bacterium]|jgi:hypothetical protein
MSALSLFHRHDPFWEMDGPAARAKRRRDRFVSITAFAASLTALGLAGFVWWMQVGAGALLHSKLGIG